MVVSQGVQGEFGHDAHGRTILRGENLNAEAVRVDLEANFHLVIGAAVEGFCEEMRRQYQEVGKSIERKIEGSGGGSDEVSAEIDPGQVWCRGQLKSGHARQMIVFRNDAD